MIKPTGLARKGVFNMENVQSSVFGLDPVWDRLINEAHEAVENEPLLGGVVHCCVLHHSSIEEA